MLITFHFIACDRGETPRANSHKDVWTWNSGDLLPHTKTHNNYHFVCEPVLRTSGFRLPTMRSQVLTWFDSKRGGDDILGNQQNKIRATKNRDVRFVVCVFVRERLDIRLIKRFSNFEDSLSAGSTVINCFELSPNQVFGNAGHWPTRKRIVSRKWTVFTCNIVTPLPRYIGLIGSLEFILLL